MRQTDGMMTYDDPQQFQILKFSIGWNYQLFFRLPFDSGSLDHHSEWLEPSTPKPWVHRGGPQWPPWMADDTGCGTKTGMDCSQKDVTAVTETFSGKSPDSKKCVKLKREFWQSLQTRRKFEDVVFEDEMSGLFQNGKLNYRFWSLGFLIVLLGICYRSF